MPCLTPGQLIKLYCDWLAKPKYFLVVGTQDQPLLLYISTDKPAFCNSNPYIDADFLLLTKREYPFLDHDSWLDCGDVCQRFTWTSVEYQLKIRMGRICGGISMPTKHQIILIIGESERLSTLHQRIIAESI